MVESIYDSYLFWPVVGVCLLLAVAFIAKCNPRLGRRMVDFISTFFDFILENIQLCFYALVVTLIIIGLLIGFFPVLGILFSLKPALVIPIFLVVFIYMTWDQIKTNIKSQTGETDDGQAEKTESKR